MATLFVVIGMPGSGKSCYIRNELRPLCAEGVCAEDYMAESHKNASRFGASRYYESLIQALKDSKNCAIADIEYCRIKKRKEIEEIVRGEVQGVEIKWYYFENDPAKCEENVNCRENRSNRQKSKERNKICELKKIYVIPPDADKIIPVWSPNKGVK